MIRYSLAASDDAELLTAFRLEVLRAVNQLPEDYAFPADAVQAIRDYWCKGDQITVVAVDGDTLVACATLCRIHVMPTFDHPTGCRGHVMNVYTRAAYRRQGIARTMLTILMDEARRQGMTELSLDATEPGRPLYASLGFTPNAEGMVLRL